MPVCSIRFSATSKVCLSPFLHIIATGDLMKKGFATSLALTVLLTSLLFIGAGCSKKTVVPPENTGSADASGGKTSNTLWQKADSPRIINRRPELWMTNSLQAETVFPILNPMNIKEFMEDARKTSSPSILILIKPEFAKTWFRFSRKTPST